MSNAFQKPGIDLILSAFSGQEVVYCPNPGNAGDSLIAAATLQLFARHGIRAEWVTWNTVVAPGKVVFYGGGGNLNEKYRQAATFLGANHRQAERLVLLPHTVCGRAELVREFGSNVDLIAREPATHAYLRAEATGANVHLAEDLALSLDLAVLRKGACQGPMAHSFGLQGSRKRIVRRAVMRHWLGGMVRPSGRNRLLAFRTDRERAGDGPIDPANHDVSQIFAYGVDTPEAAFLGARHFIDFISEYESVVTDRLHVCIGAALLGKKVTFRPNSYFKNEEVFRHSLRERFPLVEWSP